MIPRLKELYNKEIQIDLKNKLGLKNSYMAPKLVKVVLNPSPTGKAVEPKS